MGKARTLIDSLSRRIEARSSGGCWEWTGYINPSTGYAMLGTRRVKNERMAYRLMYLVVHGAIPGGRHIDHLCRNRRCVNPYHLEAVTPSINNLRAVAFRTPSGRCRNGHVYTDATTRFRSNGTRRCLVCRRAEIRNRRRRP